MAILVEIRLNLGVTLSNFDRFMSRHSAGFFDIVDGQQDDGHEVVAEGVRVGLLGDRLLAASTAIMP